MNISPQDGRRKRKISRQTSIKTKPPPIDILRVVALSPQLKITVMISAEACLNTLVAHDLSTLSLQI